MRISPCRASPPRTAGRRQIGALLLLLHLILGGCTSAPVADVAGTAALRGYPEPVFSARRVLSDDVVDPLVVSDPWHGVNRWIYGLNASIDRLALNPIVTFYRRTVPSPLRHGVTNFFDNLDMIRTTANLILQGRPKATGGAALRLLTNSTLGFGGLLDPASRFGIYTYNEDFGQTLGRYEASPGPYLMLPLFGPSNLRDSIGLAVDFLWFGFLDPLELSDNPGWGGLYYPLLVIDTRAATAFQYFETGSPFEYELVRKLYMTKRKLDIAK